ncbi:MAG: 2,4'-dihydroxyacetophenone dioxygenase family protein [Phenylobacterium sp.]|uniref:2,4'-dihydroxyacetophenone dioxygenase family protein n=1 Tax=Phenylobacterium sp. TaxID=1871053 RepID=UPI001A5B19C6|nr:2,4'-dihydroxyacetophenone dioxygenase family protein [Phenylobacterium sp.]MBL8555827.1 2,4'-dihydroxyacetophenone dioxygenase family protein [Phenylobacterium sp.]
MDDAPALDPRLAAFAQARMNRPIVPADGLLPTLHIGDDDLPWMEAGDGSALQLLHVDLSQGLWISKTRLPPGYRVATHYHTGIVFAVTLEGAWYYLESPKEVSRPGSYLFEPAGSRHTLCTPPDMEGRMVTWFAIYGANINLDADGAITSVLDARAVLDLYRGYCEALSLDCSKLIVVGG